MIFESVIDYLHEANSYIIHDFLDLVYTGKNERENTHGYPKIIDFSCGITAFKCISLPGVGAEKFLQGQLTCHMSEVSATESRLAAYCNQKGRVLTSLRVFGTPTAGYTLLLPEALLPPFSWNSKNTSLLPP